MFDTICRSGLVVAGEQFLPLNYLTWRLSWMNLKLRRATASFFFPLPTAVVPLFAGARSPVPVPTDATVQSFTPNAGHRSTRRRRRTEERRVGQESVSTCRPQCSPDH